MPSTLAALFPSLKLGWQEGGRRTQELDSASRQAQESADHTLFPELEN